MKTLSRFGIAALGVLGVAFSGCYYENDDDTEYVYVDEGPPQNDRVYNEPIEPGETMTTTPGDGAGVFIEYLGDGQWHVFVACDTNESGYACAWDVLALAPTGVRISNIEGDQLEGSDQIYTLGGSGSAGLASDTSYGLDGMYFQTDPGATVRFDVLIDGVRDARYIYWIDSEALHAGAPSNPIDLTPARP